jgi:hypothetical protein
MKNIYSKLGLSIATAAILAGCSALAKMQIHHHQLADGSTVGVVINLPPTPNWGCTSAGAVQSYNWMEIQREGALSIKGGIGLLTDKALAYANQEHLKINYINLHLPNQQTVTTGTGRFTSSNVVNQSAQATASYYLCQRINPEGKVGGVTSQDLAVTAD